MMRAPYNINHQYWPLPEQAALYRNSKPCFNQPILSFFNYDVSYRQTNLSSRSTLISNTVPIVAGDPLNSNKFFKAALI